MTPRKRDLRTRQTKILAFIGEFQEEYGMPPTVRDIQRGCDISSTSVVDYNLRTLERDGYIKRRSDVARGIELLDQKTGLPASTGATPVPIVGTIAAGLPIPAFSTEGTASSEFDTVDVRPELKRKYGALYALSVRGTSMIDALIDDGDVVVVNPSVAADNGDMVVAWLREEEEATLKKFYRDGSRIRLQPANHTMEPIYADANNVEIRGRVVEVLRQF